MEALKRWLVTVNWSQGDLAKALGTTRQAVSQWCVGKVAPGVYYVLAIEALTDGEVTPEAWLTEQQRDALIGLARKAP
jgi:DNA-binding transcriptional regulator YdaS (Cro superfamily)